MRSKSLYPRPAPDNAAHSGSSVHSDIEHVWQSGYRMGFYRGGPVLMSALSGVDIALWDLKGK